MRCYKDGCVMLMKMVNSAGYKELVHILLVKLSPFECHPITLALAFARLYSPNVLDHIK